MEHVVFFEPRYSEQAVKIWNIRGGYKYGSIVGNLQDKAKITILMSNLPAEDDAHRQRLENDFGVNFASFKSLDNPDPAFADELAFDLANAFRTIKPTIISNLNGRGVGFHYAMARAAHQENVRYVMRVAGNDIESRAKVAETRNAPMLGTERLIGALRQERIASHLAHSVIVMNNRERRRVEALTSHHDKISVCFRGVDQQHFYPAPNPSPRCRKFLFVGRQSFEKGYDILEGATDRLDFSDPDSMVSFAGTFEPGRQGLRNYIGFVNYQDLPNVYRAHDALVLCSRSEGFPQVIMEAMSCGLPCIVTRHLFEQEFRNEIDCLFVEPEASSVVAAMTRVYEDEAFFQKLRKGAIALAQKYYSETRNQQIYHDLLLGGSH